MKRFETGDTVRVDIPDEKDLDHNQLHGRRGTVIEVISDDAGTVVGDDREGYLFGIKLTDGETVDVRWRDLRPA
jgi:membrane protein implicated in regulation of membrane protease activity